MMKFANRGIRIAIAALCIFATQVAFAQYSSDFEALNASANGTLLTGQDGFYLPAGIDYFAYTYSGNVLGLPQNPAGARQFVAGTRDSGFARAQRDVDYSASRVWTVGYDVAATIDTGVGPGGAAFLGSFSTQSFPGAKTFIQLMDWHDRANPVDYFAQYIAYDSGGFQTFFPAPGPAWQNLNQNHWYRIETTFDLDLNLITAVSIKDLNTGVTTTANPSGMYLGGGAPGPGPGEPDPTGFRFFTGGAPGNVLGWDNPGVVPEPASMIALGLGLAALAARRRRKK